MGKNGGVRILALTLSLFIAVPPAFCAEIKPTVVLMPVKAKGLDRMELSAYRAALAESLSKKYDVFTGEEVDRKINEIFEKESREAMQCDTTKCFQEVAIAFQSELIATSMVLPRGPSYLLRFEIINILDNKVVYARSQPCENCSEVQVVEMFKVMVEGKEAERALRESEERYRSLVECATDAVFTLSLDGSITSLCQKKNCVAACLSGQFLGGRHRGWAQ